MDRKLACARRDAGEVILPHQSLRIVGGAIQSETPVLNETGLASTQLIRIKPDPQGLSLPEKIGGWARFYATQITNVVRAILGWEDTNANRWIAYGTTSTTSSVLQAVQCTTNATTGTTTASTAGSAVFTITPQFLSDSSPLNFQTNSGSPVITIVDSIITGVSSYDSVFISTPVSVGGIILSGLYATSAASTNSYLISATNVLGNSNPAAFSTVSAALTVTGGTYTAGSPGSLALTYATQTSAPFVVGDCVNVVGITPSTWNGSCIVTACTTTQVTVIAPSAASGTWTSGGSLSNYGVTPIVAVTSGSYVVTITFPFHGYVVGNTFSVLNQTFVGSVSLYGNYIVQSVPNSYTFTINAQSSSTITAQTWLNALTITGGSSTTSAVTLNLGQSTYVEPTIAVTSGSSTTSAVTLNWPTAYAYTFPVGSTIQVTGVTPLAWNGSYVVTGSTTTSVTYALSGSALSWVSGGTIATTAFNIGGHINVSGCTPTAWNGNYTVTSSTTTSVTYALSGTAQSWSSGGSVADIGGDEDFVYNLVQGAISSASGFGVGGFGVGGFGTGQSLSQTTGNAIYASTWSLCNWGQVLLALPVGFTPIAYTTGTYLPYGPIYAWDPTSQAQQAYALFNGPAASTGIFVAMPQRQIIAWGTTFTGIIDPLLVRWCDINNYNSWIAQVTNQAGSFRLTSGSAIIGGTQVQQQNLLWTDVGLWTMQYISQPYVYSFNQVGTGCGLIARNAFGVMAGLTYWMGSRQFFVYSGDGVQVLPCPIWDVVYQNLDQANLAKITCAVNSLFQEVTWYYPVIGGTGEVSNYIRYNASSQVWDFGVLARTAWIDNSVLGPPIGYDPVNQYLYQHEISPNADGAAMTPSFTTGYFSIAEGEMKAFLDEIWVDFRWGYYGQSQSASLSLTVNAINFPGDTPVVYGPYTVTQSTTWFNPRIRARMLSITISGADLNSFWRLGNIRYRVSPDGQY